MEVTLCVLSTLSNTTLNGSLVSRSVDRASDHPSTRWREDTMFPGSRTIFETSLVELNNLGNALQNMRTGTNAEPSNFKLGD